MAQKLIFIDEFVKEIIYSRINSKKPLILIPRAKPRERKTKEVSIKPKKFQRTIRKTKNIPKTIQKNNFRNQFPTINNFQSQAMMSDNFKAQNFQPQFQVQKISGMEKIQHLLDDPNVNTITCNGPNSPLRIKNNYQEYPTKLILNLEEINDITNYFSQSSNIPLEEGVFRVIVRNFMFSSIISNLIGNRFVITKIIPTRNFPVRQF